MMTLTNEKGEHLTTDKHGLFCWTPDPELAIALADASSAVRLARATGNLIAIQQHRSATVFNGEITGTGTRGAVPSLPTKDQAGTGSVT